MAFLLDFVSCMALRDECLANPSLWHVVLGAAKPDALLIQADCENWEDRRAALIITPANASEHVRWPSKTVEMKLWPARRPWKAIIRFVATAIIGASCDSIGRSYDQGRVRSMKS